MTPIKVILPTFLGGLFPLTAWTQLPDVTAASTPASDYVLTPRSSDTSESRALLRFSSQIVTDVKENNTVEAEIILPRDGPKPFPCVILLHYWGATDLQAEERLAKRLAEKGIASALITLPYHLRRAAPGRQSGVDAIKPEPEAIKQTMTQATFDVKRLVDWLVANPEIDSTKIGLAGISLGGIIGSLVVGVDPRIKAGAFLLAGGDLAHLLFNSSVTVDVRRALRRSGHDENGLREQLKPIEPLNHARPEISGSILIVGAKYDQVVPVADTHKLIEAWHAGHVLSLESGHYGGILVERRLYRTVADFFDSQFSTGRETVLASISTPTLRVGLSYDFRDGLTVGAGVDLLKGRNLDWRVSGFITPIGPLLYAGREIRYGFSAGLTLTKRGPSVGIVWSVVL